MSGIELAQNTIFLMGVSFMLGSLFSIFVLLILEMMRAAREAREQMHWEASQQAEHEEDIHDGEDRAA